MNLKHVLLIISLQMLIMGCTKKPEETHFNVCEVFSHQCDCPCQPVPRPVLTPEQKKLMEYYNKKKGG